MHDFTKYPSNRTMETRFLSVFIWGGQSSKVIYLVFLWFLGIYAASTSIHWKCNGWKPWRFFTPFFHNNRESAAGLEWLYWNGNDPQKRGNLKLGVIYLTFLYFVEVYAASTSIENAMVENLGDFSRLFFRNNRESAAGLEWLYENGNHSKQGRLKL